MFEKFYSPLASTNLTREQRLRVLEARATALSEAADEVEEEYNRIMSEPDVSHTPGDYLKKLLNDPMQPRDKPPFKRVGDELHVMYDQIDVTNTKGLVEVIFRLGGKEITRITTKVSGGPADTVSVTGLTGSQKITFEQ